MTDLKTFVTDHFARLNAGDIAGAAASVAVDCTHHQALPTAQGRAGFVTIMTKVRDAFPDMHQEVLDVVTDGTRVATRLRCTGTQTGAFAMTRLPLTPTGKKVDFEQLHFMRVENGQIVDIATGQDSLAMFRQLGLSITQS